MGSGEHNIKCSTIIQHNNLTYHSTADVRHNVHCSGAISSLLLTG